MPDVYAVITEVDEAADALRAEARRRVATHAFFGHVAYASITARKPRGQ